MVTVFLLLGLLGFSRWWQLKAKLHPEMARKVMHIGMGTLALTFPWLLQQRWAVLLICGLTMIVLYTLKNLKFLRRQVGDVLHSVERSSYGDLYFLMSVALLFVMAHGNWILYFVPLMVLTFADALAALAGVTYGQRHYHAAEGYKSLEGSLTFLAVTFLVTLLPLLFTQIGRPEIFIIALLVALLAMLVEAISWDGLDNILVPLIAFIVLDGHRNASLGVQLQHLVVISALTVIMFVLRRRMPLTAGALAAIALVCYVCLTIGGWLWLMAPVTCCAAALFLYRRLSGPVQTSTTKTSTTKTTPINPIKPTGASYGVRVVTSMSAPALVWLLSAQYFDRPQDYYLFCLTWAAQLAGLAVFMRQTGTDEDSPMRPVSSRSLLLPSLGASLLILVPWALVKGGHLMQWLLVWLMVVQGFFIIATVLLACAVLAQKNQLTFQLQMTVLGFAGLLGLLTFI